jgi:hypothetical protein
VKADPRFRNKPKSFWAAIRTVGQKCGYTERGKKQIKIPTILELEKAYKSLLLDGSKLRSPNGDISTYAKEILTYCEYRAEILNSFVKPRLMNAEQAEKIYLDLVKEHKPLIAVPLNKQGGAKKVPNYFTGIVNILIESGLEGRECNFNPRELTTVTREGLPVRTLARRLDGAFPSCVNPLAVWEIKEYYYTTTFGSRVADGVYETLLDGMELEDLSRAENHHIFHYLMIDAYYTWWVLGRSYLCRIIDMLNMGYVDEVFFGREVIDALPVIVKSWTTVQ